MTPERKEQLLKLAESWARIPGDWDGPSNTTVRASLAASALREALEAVPAPPVAAVPKAKIQSSLTLVLGDEQLELSGLRWEGPDIVLSVWALDGEPTLFQKFVDGLPTARATQVYAKGQLNGIARKYRLTWSRVVNRALDRVRVGPRARLEDVVLLADAAFVLEVT